MGVTYVEKNVEGTVSKKKTNEFEESATVPVGCFVENTSEPTANVGVSLSHTKNLGNYEAVKINVSLHRPCDNNPEAIESTFSETRSWCDSKMVEILADIDSDLQDL